VLSGRVCQGVCQGVGCVRGSYNLTHFASKVCQIIRPPDTPDPLTHSVLWQLDEVVGNLGYPIDTKMINLDGKEFTYEAICIIGAYLHDNNYALLHLVTNSDSYQLFVIREENCMRLMELAEVAGVDFHHVLQG